MVSQVSRVAACYLSAERSAYPVRTLIPKLYLLWSPDRRRNLKYLPALRSFMQDIHGRPIIYCGSPAMMVIPVCLA